MAMASPKDVVVKNQRSSSVIHSTPSQPKHFDYLPEMLERVRSKKPVAA
jgi:hypothetical protein